jgi:hypothetical protein
MEQGLQQVMDAPDLSQEELEEMMKLLESYETSSQRFGPVPEELQVCLLEWSGLSSILCCSLTCTSSSSLI